MQSFKQKAFLTCSWRFPRYNTIKQHTGRNPGFDRVQIEDLLLEDVVLEDVMLEDVVLEDVVLEDVLLEDVF